MTSARFIKLDNILDKLKETKRQKTSVFVFKFTRLGRMICGLSKFNPMRRLYLTIVKYMPLPKKRHQNERQVKMKAIFL